jgi:hypothetical protein
MKKADRKLLDESLSKALSPKKQKRDLDSILEEYETDAPKGIPATIPTGIPSTIPASIPEQVSPKRKPEPETFAYLDATHTAAEKNVYNFMYRETLAKGQTERHFGPAEIRNKLGIGSRNTVHRALYGLLEKLSVEKVSEANGNPNGPRYRVYHWRDIEQRRKSVGMKIDPQTKQIVAGIPRGIPTSIPDAIPNSGDSGIPTVGIPGIPNIGTLINKDNVLSSQRAKDDDEAMPTLRARAGRMPKTEAVLLSLLDTLEARTDVSSPDALLAHVLARKLAPRPATTQRRPNDEQFRAGESHIEVTAEDLEEFERNRAELSKT